MKIIFLDIDGVILPHNRSFHRKSAELLQRVVEATGAQIVLSSTWRLFALNNSPDWRTAHQSEWWEQTAEELKYLTSFNLLLYGMTPDLVSKEVPQDFRQMPDGIRGKEILVWLSEHPEVTDWVVLDDIPRWLGEEVMHRAVITHPRRGLTEEDGQKIADLLGENA